MKKKWLIFVLLLLLLLLLYKLKYISGIEEKMEMLLNYHGDDTILLVTMKQLTFVVTRIGLKNVEQMPMHKYQYHLLEIIIINNYIMIEL